MNPTLPPLVPMMRRLLLVDDNTAIHEDFRKILAPAAGGSTDVDAEAAVLFEQAAPATECAGFELDSAYQGQEALKMVRSARDAGRPYALAFVDMRMPPGWDGLTTIGRLWEADPEIQTVICTAFSDRSWEEIQAALTARERWLVLKKPFDQIEVLQLAHALTEKWKLSRLAALKVEALERMVHARTLDLQNAHRVAHEFLANANHELLTPMNGLCGFQDLLADTPLTEEQREYLQEARTACASLLRLMHRILDFNRTEAGTLAVEPVDFSPATLLKGVAEEYAAAAAAKGIRLQIDTSRLAPERWHGPETILRKALAPLVDNALKFTPQGLVTLAVEPHAPGLALSVIDTGVGLTPQQLEWILIPCAQVDGSLTRRTSGMGLGLLLARRLTQAMGGELTLNGKPNQGVTARFTVKARPTDASAKVAA
jgi:signal transduction histidine kinase